MKESGGKKVLEGYDEYKKTKAGGLHNCELCDGEIQPGETYYKYRDKETGWEKKACSKHLDEKLIKQYQIRRQRYVAKREKGQEIWLETDASSGDEAERWAFIAHLGEKEICRQHGFAPGEIRWITPAESYAILKAIEWLSKAEKEGQVPPNLPVVVSSDNYPVHSKLVTQSEHGRYDWLWRQLNKALLPYRREGRLFVEFRNNVEADFYASKTSFDEERRSR